VPKSPRRSGIILPNAINAFLHKPCDDLSWLKSVRTNELLSALRDLDPHQEHDDLMIQQMVGMLAGIAYPQFCFFYGMGCVDAGTEYLSRKGWERMDAYKGGRVMQYDPVTRTGRFVTPTSYLIKPCEWMYRFKTARGVDQLISPEHKVLYADSTGQPKTTSANDVATETTRTKKGWRNRFYTTFTPIVRSRLPLNNNELRVQVAVIADGHFRYKPDNKIVHARRLAHGGLLCDVRLKKDRKKIRLRALLRAAKIKWIEKPCLPVGYSKFTFLAPRRDKEFTTWYWRANVEQLNIISDECIYWDGHKSESSRGDSFASRSRQSADFVQYAFCAARRTASIAGYVRKDLKIDYQVIARKGDALLHLQGYDESGNQKRNVWKEHTIDGKKYCFEVPSGFLVLRRNGCIFMTGNTGKTRLVLRLFKHWLKTQNRRRFLVVIPSEEAITTWEDESALDFFPLPVLPLISGSSDHKRELLQSMEEGLAVVPYASLRAMCCTSRRVKDENKWVPHTAKIARVTKGLDGISWDEVTEAKEKSSLNFRINRAISNPVPIRYGLAGRPFGRDPTDLWAQQYLTDRGASLGPTLGLFRAAFFNEKPREWGSPYSVDYELKEGVEPEIHRHSCHRALYYSTEECVDLPPLSKYVVRIPLPPETYQYYDKIMTLLIAARGDHQEQFNYFIRLRQLSSGFLGMRADQYGAKSETIFDRNPKLDVLIERLQRLPRGAKAVVFNEFLWSGERISKALTAAKIKHVRVWGDAPDRPGRIRKFQTDPECSVLVAAHQLTSYSLNLQMARWVFYYESPVSCIDRDQSEKRCWRKGQTGRVMMYDLVVTSADEQILKFHKEGGDLWEAVRRDPTVLRRAA